MESNFVECFHCVWCGSWQHPTRATHKFARITSHRHIIHDSRARLHGQIYIYVGLLNKQRWRRTTCWQFSSFAFIVWLMTAIIMDRQRRYSDVRLSVCVWYALPAYFFLLALCMSCDELRRWQPTVYWWSLSREVMLWGTIQFMLSHAIV